MNYVVDVSNQFGTVENFADDLCFNGSDYTKFKTVSYDESYRQKTWTYCWQGINKACVFIAHIDGNTAVSEAERADYKAQARFARAYYYWALLRKYGITIEETTCQGGKKHGDQESSNCWHSGIQRLHGDGGAGRGQS